MAPLISAQEVSKSFGITPLFSGLSIAIEEHERVAILGRNGSGKSTLLKILSRIDEPDSGIVSWRKGLKVSYVPQQDSFKALTAHAHLETALTSDDYDKERKIRVMLTRIGISDVNQKIEPMSGGERKRLAIAYALMNEPEVLLLDEPTNHLDIQGVNWLEDLLIEGSFATVFISHDRYFIENVAERVVEIDPRYANGTLTVKGGYSSFIETRETYFEQLEHYRASLANKVRREVQWLRQGAKARTTKQKGRSDQAKELIAELSGITVNTKNANIEFAASQRKTRELIKIEKISKAFGERTLFRDVSLVLSPGTRLGVVGTNGSGKSTFLKTVLQQIKPDSGRVIHANNLRIALLDQMRSVLNKDQTLRKLLCPDGDSVVFNGQQIHIAGWARRFLFQQDQLSLPVSQLSGGERARALIAKLMVEPADVLVLDEPTNDLDISTLEVLEDALSEFPGAVILVTHDRYMLDRVCQLVLGLSGEGEAVLCSDYRQWEETLRGITEKRDDANSSSNNDEALSKPQSSTAQKLSQDERRELGGIEQKISRSEAMLKSLTEKLHGISSSGPTQKEFEKLCSELAKLQHDVEALYSRWAELDARSKN